MVGGQNLKGRCIAISGGTRGLGLATVHHVVEAGARVWIFGSREATIEPVLAEFDVVGATACDIRDEEAVEEGMANALEGLGQIDGAFVNAGIEGQDRDVLSLDSVHFRDILEVNVVGSFHFSRAAARHMGPGSTIVFNASVNGVRPQAGFADYNASKAATISLAQTTSLDLSHQGIAVSVICPGYIRTSTTAPYLDAPFAAREILAGVPAGRFGSPEEVARLVAFLLAPEAAYLTGSVISIDGGRSV